MAIMSGGVWLGSPSMGEHPRFWPRAGAVEQPTFWGAKRGFPQQPGVPARVAAQARCALYRDFRCAAKGRGFRLCFRWGSQCCGKLDPSASGGRDASSKGEVLLNCYNYPYFWTFSLPLLTTREQSHAPPASLSPHLPAPVAGGETARRARSGFSGHGELWWVCVCPLSCWKGPEEGGRLKGTSVLEPFFCSAEPSV